VISPNAGSTRSRPTKAALIVAIHVFVAFAAVRLGGPGFPGDLSQSYFWMTEPQATHPDCPNSFWSWAPSMWYFLPRPDGR
jgi:hypothetical protein